MTLPDTPAHWAQIDPGPLTQAARDARVQRILAEMRTETAAAERLNHARKVPQVWRKALHREHQAEIDRLTERLTREQTRPLKEPR